MANRIYPPALPNPVTPLGHDGTDFKALKLDANGALVVSGAGSPPAAHAASHQFAGSDMVNVYGLAGRLLNPQNADSLQGHAVSALAPGDNDVLTYDLAADQWRAEPWSAILNTAWFLVYGYTLAAATQVWDIPSLDLVSAAVFHISMALKNNTAGTLYVSLYVNGDYTTTNYYVQNFQVNGTGVTCARGNSGVIDGIAASACEVYDGRMMMDPNGVVRAHFEGNTAAPSAVVMRNVCWITKAAVANVTSIRISSDQANGLAIGSRVIILGMF